MILIGILRFNVFRGGGIFSYDEFYHEFVEFFNGGCVFYEVVVGPRRFFAHSHSKAVLEVVSFDGCVVATTFFNILH